jgi:FMN phosphatase YigB (HAD superfamily)/glutathione synthase/RimK-type ligase-like ATP-grasp enzyme
MWGGKVNTAIVVGGGGFQGLPVLRSLHAIDWRVIIADSIPESLNRYEADAFHQLPPVKEYAAFRTAIRKLCFSAQAIFPTTMHDLPALAKLRPELEHIGVRVFVSPIKLIDLLSDKVQTVSFLLEAGLPTLPAVDPYSHNFSYPLIGKPKNGWGGLGILKIRTLAQLNTSNKDEIIANYLWQRELNDFTEWSVDFAIGNHGALSPLVARQRIRSSGGFAVISRVIDAPHVESLAKRVAFWLVENQGYGLFNIQILEDVDGTLWLSDINPRPGTSSICALSAGVNLVEFLITPHIDTPHLCHGFITRTLKETFFQTPSNNISGVVFDLDETLICQKSWMQEKLKGLLTELSSMVNKLQIDHFQQEALRLIDEGPWNQLIDIALARSGLPADYAQVLIDLWRKIHPQNIVIHQDALALIRALQAQKIPIAILSDNPIASQCQKIERLPKEIIFQSIVLTDAASSPKPASRGFLDAAASLALPPEALIMIGDSPWRDGIGALQAGYAHAVIIQRNGSMTNPLRRLIEQAHPNTINRISWLNSLFGLEHLLEFAK